MRRGVTLSNRKWTSVTTASTATGSFFLRLALAVGIVFAFALLSHAGGPKYVAGVTYFDSTMTGQPLVWPQGMTYYTDQGDLSPILQNGSANSLVADAFAQWTSISTAAVAAASGGQLAEDVNGANVTLNSDGTISMPADIQPTATSTPIGIVYDYDGSVTDALIGAGAGDSSQCFFNAAFGGNDNYGSLGTYQHALIVINGQCAQSSSQVVEVEYRMVRVIGGLLGMGWSQLNTNVITGSPRPTSDDYAGFPVMHNTDPLNCVPITMCYAKPYQMTMDDIAELSRLYPVTAQNQADFSAKQIFSTATGSVHGSVWFTDSAGNRTQPMQGVNVVARWIDPTTKLPSRRYAASSVSGFLFTGNAGNTVTGFNDNFGNPYSDWGSTNNAVEGFYDLAGLQLPGGGSGQYQLSVEPLDLIWSVGVGPYAPWLVQPSGGFQAVLVTVTAGLDMQQDILMTASTQPVPSPSSAWTAPMPVPVAGNWMGSLSGYGDMAYFLLPVQVNRTFSVGITALDDSGNASESKARPVIGLWAASDPQGTQSPAFTKSAFNTSVFGFTRLDAQVNSSTNLLIGVSDARGDGRPDYHYQAHVLYANSVLPSRVGIGGGAVGVQGLGFGPALNLSVGSESVAPLAVTAGQIVLAAPPFSDGAQNITITDPTTGASSTMTGALIYGATATDNIVLLSALNPSTRVGTPAVHPMSVRVLAADAVTPVSGATIGWSAGNGLQLSACGGASSCLGTTDESGTAVTSMTPAAVGIANVTATLAPGVYSSTKSVSTTLNAIESTSDIGALNTYLWIAQGASTSIPLSARVLSNGAPQSNVAVKFTVVSGSGTLSAGTAQSDSSGYATVTLSLAAFTAQVQLSACVSPANAPCAPFYAIPVPPATLKLQPVTGAGQVSPGLPFQPLVVRVTDSSSPPNPVLAATVAFQTTVLRPGGSQPVIGGADTNTGNPAMPVILSVSQSSAFTDINGLASLPPTGGSFSPPLVVDVMVTAGTSATLNDPLVLLPAIPSGGNSGGNNPGSNSGTNPPPRRLPIAIGRATDRSMRECGYDSIGLGDSSRSP